jgi:hypothetical protein
VRLGVAAETLEPGPDLADRLVARVAAWSNLRSPHSGPGSRVSDQE